MENRQYRPLDSEVESSYTELPELLVNGELRRQYLSRCSRQPLPLVSSFFRHRTSSSQINIPLTVRAIAGTLLGLLLLQLLGDEVLAGQWETLPDVLTALFFDKVV